MKRLDELVNRQRFFRRLVLVWSMALVSFVVIRTMQPEVLTKLPAPAATAIVAFVGILATVITFYQWHRSQDDKR